jgi:hypothetical protein
MDCDPNTASRCDSNTDHVTHPDYNAYTNRYANTGANRHTDHRPNPGTRIGVPAYL